MNLLFVCSRNRWRSPTAEQIFAAAPGIETRSAGVARDAENPLTAESIAWAEAIFVMEPVHRAKMQRFFGRELRGKKVVCLNIGDDYEFMSPALIELLWERVPRSVPALHGMRPR